MEQIDIEGMATKASRIALGTWAMGGWKWGGSDESEAVRTIHAALDHGINLIDTAPVYGFGRSEELVGKALAGGHRQRALIATKVGLEWRDGKVFRNSSPARLRQELEDSLRRLQTDVIDLYQVHWPDESVPIEETAAVLEGFRRDGKIRAIGVSNFSPAQMERFQAAASLQTVQPPYNLFERQIETDVLPYAQRRGLTVLAYGALCRGLLTGKITAASTFEGDDLRKTDPKFAAPQAWPVSRRGPRARGARPRPVRQDGAGPGRPVAARSRPGGSTLGCSAARPADAGQRGHGLVAG